MSDPCHCPACRKRLEPFTVDHFRVWALELELDNGDPWIVEDYFARFLEDYFAGIPECWLLVPEANAKTTSLAGLSLYLLEHRSNAWIPWAASSRDQAEIGYRQAEGFVLRSRRLRELMKPQEGYRRIKNLQRGGRIQIFAAGDDHADGVIPTDAFIDELHRHKDLRLYRTWRGKLEKRGGQIATISTAGEPGSEFETTREHVRQETPVVDRGPGFVLCRSEHIALHEYAVDETADVEDMEAVKAANPASFITVETLESKRATPTMTVGHWSRFVCNRPTRSSLAAISEAEWFAQETDDEIPPFASIWVGLDIGWRVDPTAIVPFWWRDNEHRLFGRSRVLIPPGDGSSLDPRAVESALLEIHGGNQIETVVMDIHHGEQLAEWIRDEIGAEVVERGQSLTAQALDYSRFMEALREGWLWHHRNDEPFTRHALNAVARQLPRGDEVFDRPVRGRHSRDQDRRVIDALDAAAMVHSVAVAEHAREPELVGSWRGV